LHLTIQAKEFTDFETEHKKMNQASSIMMFYNIMTYKMLSYEIISWKKVNNAFYLRNPRLVQTFHDVFFVIGKSTF